MAREVRVGREIALFLGLTALFSGVVYIPIIRAGSEGSSLGALLMLAPGLAAVITYLVCEHSLRPVGWKPGRVRYLLFALAIPFVYCLIAYGSVWLTGNGGYAGGLSVKLLVTLAVLLVAGTLSASFEEIGWRGLLVPRLMSVWGFTTTSLVSGLIWALWHYPLIIFSNVRLGNAPLAYSLVCFTIFTIGLSFAAAWLRMASGSMWAAALLHGSHNAVMLHVFNPLTVDTGRTWYLVGEQGALTAAAGLVLAAAFFSLRLRLPRIAKQPPAT